MEGRIKEFSMERGRKRERMEDSRDKRRNNSRLRMGNDEYETTPLNRS